MSYSYEIVEKIKQFFEEDDWHYEFNEEHGVFTGGINLSGKLKSVRFFLSVNENLLISYVVLNISVDEEKRRDVAEYLGRANYGLNRGCFEMDFDDGEIRYRIPISEAEINDDYEKAMHFALILPCRMIEHYGDELLSVMFGFVDPKDAINKVEQS